MRIITTASLLILIAATVSAQERIVSVTACVVREADYVGSTVSVSVASGPQYVLTDAQNGNAIYTLTGTREADLGPHVGQRLELTGHVERVRTMPVLTTADDVRAGTARTQGGAAGATPDGAAAHEASDALSATVQADAPADPGAGIADPAYRIATLPRLNAASFTRVGGTCAMPQPRASTAVSAAAQRVPAVSGAGRESITARGCLVRHTETGTALTAQSSSADVLVLTTASVTGSPSLATRGAVPGSSPTGNGSGTVPSPVGTSGTTLTFALETSDARRSQLTRFVGERVEIVGTIDERVTPPPAGTAHPSAPVRRIAVTGFRALGGACQ